MMFNRLKQIGVPAIVKEENPLAEAPQWRGTEFIGSRSALDDVISEEGSHMVHQQIRKQIGRYVAQGCS